MGLFGRKKVDDSEQPNPQLDAELERLSALAIPRLAPEVMSKGFASDYDPTDDGTDAAVIANELCPMPAIHLLMDTTVHAQRRAAEEASDPTSTGAKFLRLQDVVAEGLQPQRRRRSWNRSRALTESRPRSATSLPAWGEMPERRMRLTAFLQEAPSK